MEVGGAPLVTALETVGAAEGSSTIRHARCGRGPEHRDPFDRVLAAQAVVEGLTLVSKDRGIGGGDGVGVGCSAES